MNNIKKVLVPFNFSEVSETAINYTSGLINGDQNIAVTLLHVPESEITGSAREKLEHEFEALITQHSKSIPSCGYEIVNGNLITSILEIQASGSYDLIIIGTEGSLDDDTQTNASKLVFQADCPVLVVPENSENFSMKNIALALGQNPIDNSGGFQVLHDIARAYNATVHILTVQRDGQTISIENRNQEVLEYYLESLLYFHAFPKNSDIEIGLSDYIREKNIDMLAIIPRNHVKNAAPSEGRLTKLLTLHAEVPLLTID